MTVTCNAEIILMTVKIFQFPHGTCCGIGQHALCGKENLIGHKYEMDINRFQSERDTYVH